MNRWRWRLARLIAPVPVMADPFPGDETFLVIRTNGTVASYRVDTLDLVSTNALDLKRFGDSDGHFAYGGRPPRTTFSGTIR